VPEKDEVDNAHKAGNSMNLVQKFIVDYAYTPIVSNLAHFLRADHENCEIPSTDLSKQSLHDTLAIEAGGEVGGILHGDAQNVVNDHGTFVLFNDHQNDNLNQPEQKVCDALHIIDDKFHSLSSHAALGSQQSITLGSPRVSKNEGKKGAESMLFVLENTAAKTVKRSKHREGSVDEDSSARAERLNAKKNLDDAGMSRSKSFLSISDPKMVNNIATLGVSIGNDIKKSIVSMKEVELNRLLQNSISESKHKDSCQLFDDETSEVDSDLGFDQQAI
jgi:hypothetical protein